MEKWGWIVDELNIKFEYVFDWDVCVGGFLNLIVFVFLG